MKRLVKICTCVVIGTLVLNCAAQAATVTNSGQTNLTGGSTYDTRGGQPWTISYLGIDMSGMASGAMNLTFGDNSSGSGWENFTIQLHKDTGGTQLWLAQAYDKWFAGGPISSHGFNSGAVTGAFDIRAIIQQNLDSKWAITPQYRIPAGSGNSSDGSIGSLDTWHTFYDGSYVSSDAFDLTVLEVWSQLDPGSTTSSDYATIVSGSANVAQNVVPVPGAFLLGSMGMSIVGWMRRRRTL